MTALPMNALMDTYSRSEVTFVRGEGSWLYDDQGKDYLDFLGGLAVVAIGHAHPAVTAAVAKQMDTLVHVSNLYSTEPMITLAERLADISGLDRVFFTNDGATANEAAIKLARRYGQKHFGPDRYEVISLLDSFHGRTLATLAATGQPGKQATFQPLPAGFIQVEAGNLEVLTQLVDQRTAAVMLETVQAEGGVIPLPDDYLHEVRQLCDATGTLLIIDDVQAGVGRTGEWYSWQSLGISPDIATTAKALANGLPIGACLATEKVASAFAPGDHGTTFGGGPVICSAALAVLDIIESEGFLKNCRARSSQLQRGLSLLQGVKQVRGKGLLLAAQLDHERANEVASSALQHGLVVNAVRPDAIRFTPPLSVTADEVELGIDRFRQALA
ncbi:MAG: acetylornithine transaminase [Acidimicrobiia bacterium]|nr:acetylornithine transaminase [Acidimicrobiia bacterium]MDQ3499427.1 acetylornithine transaminase [Actinomycetota bacterium]